jgi:hypothetical protein
LNPHDFKEIPEPYLPELWQNAAREINPQGKASLGEQTQESAGHCPQNQLNFGFNTHFSEYYTIPFWIDRYFRYWS